MCDCDWRLQTRNISIGHFELFWWMNEINREQFCSGADRHRLISVIWGSIRRTRKLYGCHLTSMIIFCLSIANLRLIFVRILLRQSQRFLWHFKTEHKNIQYTSIKWIFRNFREAIIDTAVARACGCMAAPGWWSVYSFRHAACEPLHQPPLRFWRRASSTRPNRFVLRCVTFQVINRFKTHNAVVFLLLLSCVSSNASHNLSEWIQWLSYNFDEIDKLKQLIFWFLKRL